ncbi:MAG: metallophosphoesterase family protein [Planctomycetota bacterium]|jgi:predicted MPP superfamily phosphohydrolase
MSQQEFIAIVSDMHIAPFDTGTNRQQAEQDMPERRAKHLDTAYDQLKAGPKPAAILFGGDNTNQPVSRPNYKSFGHEFMNKFKDISECHVIPGNHDVGSTAGWHHHDPEELEKACQAFCEDYDEKWVLEKAGFRIIAVNSQICGSGLEREKEQAEWLREKLAEPTELIKTVFFHTPLYLKGPDDDFDDGSEMMCLRPEARKPLLQILRENPPQLVITTHAHRFWIDRQESWDWLGIPATALGQHEMGKVPSHNLPKGDDNVGWVALSSSDGGWEAEIHIVSSEQ